MSILLTTTRSGARAPSASNTDPAPACDTTRLAARIASSRLGRKSKTSDAGSGGYERAADGTFHGRSAWSERWYPRARRMFTTAGLSSASTRASNDVVPTVTKTLRSSAGRDVDARAASPRDADARGGMVADAERAQR